MKRKLTQCLVVFVMCAMLTASCGKNNSDDKGSTQVAIEVTDITTTSAKVGITVTGKAPTLNRFIDAVALDKLEAEGISLTDRSAVAKYITDNGTVVSLPYTTTASSLEPFENYLTGVACYDSDFQLIAVEFKEFQTLSPDGSLGDQNNAGSIDNNQW